MCLAAASGGCGGGDPMPWSDVIKPRPAEEQQQTIRTSDHLVVYLDASASMAGYVSPDGQTSFAASPDGQTVFSRTLQELRTVVTTLDPDVSVVFRKIAERVEPPSFNDLELGQSSVSRSPYRGGETNLAGALSLFTEPLAVPRRAVGQADPEDELRPARFHVLITDGVQSTKQQRLDESCVTGSDYVCVRRAISNLLNRGWGGSIIGIRSEFRGKVYSEINRGHVIQYESRRSDPTTYRPFYLYIFSPDRAALGKLVETLKGRLRPLLKPEDGLREYALTPLYANDGGSAEIVIPKESADYLERTKAREENPPRLTLRVDLNAEKRGPLPFNVMVTIPWSSHARDSGTPQELAELLRWELEEINGAWSESGAGRRRPEAKLTGQQVDEQGRVIIQATAQWPPGTGTPSWRAYRIVGRLDSEKLTPPWVRQWSTNLDMTVEAANRTLNLESALAGLWHNPATKQQMVMEIYLRVGPE